ncbi:uncharacterized protein DUF4935 [Arcticibacter tournemirensis]|uniref:DUF4935 domain-containing protein n=1 Tax=Arcticibacter tournemirensis TaxID=699437 RepID=A0A5M9HJ10_9SPHI|nr:PIN domain-containing protein [Arcticibacter tournemirensis]KAA8485388.1 DUF4935 domain-containing protein [Arcticibacter tournemirensis]TQM50320.1 uncharacterized protein DUF4935 [Arcticibacter tournemirensis]
MKVVLDTNIIYDDFNFKKPNSQILLRELKGGKLTLHVPEIVLDEIVNKFRQRMDKAHKQIKSELDTIKELALEELTSPTNDQVISDLVNNYRDRLMSLFEEYDVKLIPYPKTDHRFLAKKAMLKTKPFNTNEKGYRDNLIWENIKSLISGAGEEIASRPELVFVTNNHTDFMAGDKLHEDLVNELDEQDLQSDTVAVYRNLKEFVDNVLNLYVVQEDVFRERLNANDFWDFELKSIIEEYLDNEYVGHNLSKFEFSEPGDYPDEDREITAYHENFQIRDLTVKKLSADEFVVDAKIDIETELEFFVDKSDYYSSRDEEYAVIDSDWNKHVMLVGQTETIPFDVTLIVNSKLKCQSIELNKTD